MKRREFAKGKKRACVGKIEEVCSTYGAPNGNDWFLCLPPSPSCFISGAQPQVWCSEDASAGHMGLPKRKDISMGTIRIPSGMDNQLCAFCNLFFTFLTTLRFLLLQH